jgi:hypothetical protein
MGWITRLQFMEEPPHPYQLKGESNALSNEYWGFFWENKMDEARRLLLTSVYNGEVKTWSFIFMPSL